MDARLKSIMARFAEVTRDMAKKGQADTRLVFVHESLDGQVGIGLINGKVSETPIEGLPSVKISSELLLSVEGAHRDRERGITMRRTPQLLS